MILFNQGCEWTSEISEELVPYGGGDPIRLRFAHTHGCPIGKCLLPNLCICSPIFLFRHHTDFTHKSYHLGTNTVVAALRQRSWRSLDYLLAQGITPTKEMAQLAAEIDDISFVKVRSPFFVIRSHMLCTNACLLQTDFVQACMSFRC